MSNKPKWSLRPIDDTEAHIVCTCGDVSVYLSQDKWGFSLMKRINGDWSRVDNPLWGDLTSAMAEAERICRGTPDQQPDTPPPLSGEWRSCEHGINADDGDWVLYAWRHKLGWQYAAAQVSCDVDDEDGSGSLELLDWDGNQVEMEPSDYYAKIKP